MLATLRMAPRQGYIALDGEFQLDLLWFQHFLPQYNGIQIITIISSNITVEADSCLSGCGAICGKEYYHTSYPHHIMQANLIICRLEMLNLVVAVKGWSYQWRRKNVLIYCDNSAAIYTLQSIFVAVFFSFGFRFTGLY